MPIIIKLLTKVLSQHTPRPLPPSRIESSPLYRLFRLDPVLTNIIESKFEIVPGVEDKEVALWVNEANYIWLSGQQRQAEVSRGLVQRWNFRKCPQETKFFVYKISSSDHAACAQYSGKNSSLKVQSLEKSGFCSAGRPSVSRSGLTFTFRPQEREKQNHMFFINRICRTNKIVTCR